MENKDLIIIALIVALIYLYYQNKKLSGKITSSLETLTPGNSQKLFEYNSDSEEEVPFPSRQKLQFELDEVKKEIKKLKESKDIPEDYAELETERDEAIRDKKTAEQENISLSNKLKLKNQEVSRKDTEITRLKKEKGEKEVSLNEKIKELKEKNTKLEERHKKREKLLDEEQTDNNKLTNKIAELETKIAELENQKPEMPGSWSDESDDETKKKKKKPDLSPYQIPQRRK
jgi:chromosome segregation ATPase